MKQKKTPEGATVMNMRKDKAWNGYAVLEKFTQTT